MEKRKSVEYATLAEDRRISTVVHEQQEQQRLVASETRQGIMAGIRDRVHASTPLPLGFPPRTIQKNRVSNRERGRARKVPRSESSERGIEMNETELTQGAISCPG